ncbi:uncharacterized protein LOC105700918 [Orussus abietinus]|uniref:uncharacterized protein LOC105700918 n=1 Tax=Orussus abietinus TaxID=222816 RepID=UPI0006251937|nr:uncharacterized protein LOC105700918 [Orussus abietinus]
MARIKSIASLKDARVIVIDEDLEATYARSLIAGWLSTWNERKTSRPIDLLSFSCPQRAVLNLPDPFRLIDMKVHDLYSIRPESTEVDECKKLENVIDLIRKDSTVIVDCLSGLTLSFGLKQALHFLNKLRFEVQQLICIYRRDFYNVGIPRIDTLGDFYIRLEQSSQVQSSKNYIYKALLLEWRKNPKYQTELVEQDRLTYSIESTQVIVNTNRKVDVVKSDNVEKIQASFRIEIGPREMEQREKTVLPYTQVRDALRGESKIFYQPDETDDVDEEDPDDDLLF